MGSAAGPGHRAEVGHRLAPVGLVDHGRQHHQPVHAEALGIAREAAGQRGGVFGDARKHGDAPGHRASHRLQHGELFAVLERRILAHAAQQDHSVNAGADQQVEMLRGGLQIERLVGMELCRQGGEYASPVRFHSGSHQ